MAQLHEAKSPYAISPYKRRPVSQLENLDESLFLRVLRPEDADFFVFPFNLASFVYHCGLQGDVPGIPSDPSGNTRFTDFLYSLPYFRESQEQNVIFMNDHDWCGPFGVKCVVFNSSISRKNPNPNMISSPFLIRDIGNRGEVDFKDLRYHSSFAGYLGSSPVRDRLVYPLLDFLKERDDIKIYIDGVNRYHSHIKDKAERDQRRNKYYEVIRQSITVLCPKGSGMNSTRFFEILCMGRIPVLISNDCVLPMEDEIPWNSYILRIREELAGEAGTILSAWFRDQNEFTLKRRFALNRSTWLAYFQPSKQQEFLARSLWKVHARLEKLQKRPLSNRHEDPLTG